jgi:hypothetical protein
VLFLHPSVIFLDLSVKYRDSLRCDINNSLVDEQSNFLGLENLKELIVIICGVKCFTLFSDILENISNHRLLSLGI